MLDWKPISTLERDDGLVFLTCEFDGPGDWRYKTGGIDYKGNIDVIGASWTPSHWAPISNSPDKVKG